MGRTNFKKTYLVQRLAVNNLFGKLYQAEWISQISLSKNGETEIQSCFDYSLEFHYLKNINKFDSPLKEFKLKTGKVDDNDTNFTNLLIGMEKMKLAASWYGQRFKYCWKI